MPSSTAPPRTTPVMAWRGAKGQFRWKLETFALLAALGVHFSFTLISADQPLNIQHEIDAFEFITMDEPEEPLQQKEVLEPEPVEFEEELKEPYQGSTERTPSHSLPEPNAGDVAPPGDQSDNEALEGEAAAPVIVSDFGDGPGSFSMVSGEGTKLRGGRSGKVGGGRGRGRGSITSVAARDLSRAAIAPVLKPYLERNYPSSARLNGVSGQASVTVIIQPDGTTTDIRVLNVSTKGYSFGETCSRSVHQGPKWKPALNKNGRPFASEVTYTCDFIAPKRDVAASSGKPTVGAGANRVWSKPAGG